MLEAARKKLLDPDLSVRNEALETLWDAWERIKALEILERGTSQPQPPNCWTKPHSEPNFRKLFGGGVPQVNGD